MRIFKEDKKTFYNVYEFIAIVGRYGIDDETEQEFKRVFNFFDIRKKQKINCLDLKHGF